MALLAALIPGLECRATREVKCLCMYVSRPKTTHAANSDAGVCECRTGCYRARIKDEGMMTRGAKVQSDEMEWDEMGRLGSSRGECVSQMRILSSKMVCISA